MDRCALAYDYHKQGYNCAQSVAGAFGDRTGWPMDRTAAAMGAFGRGVGGEAELCGALSGAVLVLSLLFPYDGSDPEKKQALYGLAQELRERFLAAFGHTRCGDLLSAQPQLGPTALRLGAETPCDGLIITAVELLEQMLSEMERERRGLWI